MSEQADEDELNLTDRKEAEFTDSGEKELFSDKEDPADLNASQKSPFLAVSIIFLFGIGSFLLLSVVLLITSNN